MTDTTQQERLYHLVAVNERTGKQTQVTSYPMSHRECCTCKSKFSHHPARRIMLVDA